MRIAKRICLSLVLGLAILVGVFAHDGQYSARYNQFTGAFVGVTRVADGLQIPNDPDNPDWQAFLAWNAVQSPPLDTSDGPAPSVITRTAETYRAKVATRANITLSGTQVIDDYSVQVDDVVLVKAQTTEADNGLYLCKSSTWARAPEMLTGGKLGAGIVIRVSRGDQYGNTEWMLETTTSVTVGTDAQIWRLLASPKRWTPVPGLRLSLDNGLPVTTSNVTGATSIYLLPHINNVIELYHEIHEAWEPFTLSAGKEMPLGTLSNNTNYDIFVYDDGGVTPTYEFVAWTNSTTRATAVVYQNGRWVKSGSLHKRYVGSFRTTSTTTTEDSDTKRFLFNAYNRMPRVLKRVETTDSWAGGTADTWVKANNSDSNRVEVLIGLSEGPVNLRLRTVALNDAAVVLASGGIGVDSASVNSADYFGGVANTTFGVPAFAEYNGIPAIGWHYFQWLEYRGAGGNTTWYGDAGGNAIQSGLTGVVWN